MPTALIIGFSYENSSELTLPGVSIDLYLIYKMVVRAKFTDILVVTDIENDQSEAILAEAIVSEIADSDLYRFLTRLKESSHYVKYTTKDALVEVIRQACQDDQLLFYYSGHGRHRHFILPNDKLSMTELVSSIRQECLAIIDCCNGGLELPYRLNTSGYRLCNSIFPRATILCLSASQEGESSFASHKGSVFTRNIVKAICPDQVRKGRTKRRIQDIRDEISKACPITISSTRPNVKDIWSWVRGKSIEVTIEDNLVKIRKRWESHEKLMRS